MHLGARTRNVVVRHQVAAATERGLRRHGNENRLELGWGKSTPFANWTHSYFPSARSMAARSLANGAVSTTWIAFILRFLLFELREAL